MKPYAELLEFNQPNPIRKKGFTRIRDAFPGLLNEQAWYQKDSNSDFEDGFFLDPERIMEFAGRWDYGENNARKLGETVVVQEVRPGPYIDGSPATTVAKKVPIIQKYISMGHESMIEMGDATFFIECSRVVSHELVRHRIASFQQESQRFVKYDHEDPDALFFFPPELEGVEGIWAWEPEMTEFGPVPGTGDEGLRAEDAMDAFYQGALDLYKTLREKGVAPQIARYVFPNGMRTRLIMKTNIREWRHILRLRLDKSAQPEMQELAQQIYDQLVDVFPNAMAGVLDGGRGVR